MSMYLKQAVAVAETDLAETKVREAVEQIIANVREPGDDAVRELSHKLDGWSPQRRLPVLAPKLLPAGQLRSFFTWPSCLVRLHSPTGGFPATSRLGLVDIIFAFGQQAMTFPSHWRWM
jgi:hypothetical protein